MTDDMTQNGEPSAMARQSSKGSGSRSKSTGASSDSASADAGELGGDTVLVGDGAMGEDTVAPESDPGTSVTIEPGDTAAPAADADDPSRTELVDDMSGVRSDEDRPAETMTERPAPTPAPAPVAARGPGVVTLLIGGVVAAGLGYAAAFFGLQQPAPEAPQTDPALTVALATLDAQQGTITSLEAQIAALAAVEPPVVPEVDLSGVEGAIARVAADVAGVASSVETLSARVVVLEDRPVFTGEATADNAAMAAAVDALEQRLNTERDAAAEALAAAEAARAEAAAAQAAATAELQAASEAAQAAIAEAEARAQATAAATQTQAALSRLQIAMASGAPFAEALADLPGDAPEALAAAAETGVPTLDELQAAYPAAARAALPIALRELAGDSASDRVGAFLLGQIGGRSVEPREGDDPDAVLSRAEAAVASGDLEGALTELSALPEGAQAMMADWIALVETRAAADAAMAELAATLDN
jgi:hypothetical protein